MSTIHSEVFSTNPFSEIFEYYTSLTDPEHGTRLTWQSADEELKRCTPLLHVLCLFSGITRNK